MVKQGLNLDLRMEKSKNSIRPDNPVLFDFESNFNGDLIKSDLSEIKSTILVRQPL